MELILTVMASDRPGIVERIAEVVEAEGGSWMESRLAHMAGRFAGIIRVYLDRDHYGSLQRGLQALRNEGLSIQVEVGEPASEAFDRHSIEVVGNDRNGIVREVTQTLASLQVNVLDLNTEVKPASMSGGVLFRAEIELGLSPTQRIETVIGRLEELSSDLMIDRIGLAEEQRNQS